MTRLNKEKLPDFLKSKQGWVTFMEKNRTNEPHVHQIEPTNECPYTCVMCPRTKNMTRPTGFMDINIYKLIIDEINTFSEPIKAKEIELFHFGESLLHPELETMIQYASSKNLKLTLSLNPPHLNEDIMKKIINANPYKIIISFDGYDNKSYKKIRGKSANFDLAITNINKLISYHEKVNSNSIIEIRMIKMKINENSIDKFYNLWKNKKNIKVEVRDFFPWTEKRLISLGNVEKWDSFKPCKFPWSYLVVQYNGDIVGCCRDYNGHNVLGNIKNNSLVEIWNGPAYEAFRKQHETGHFKENDFCKNCTKIYYSED